MFSVQRVNSQSPSAPIASSTMLQTIPLIHTQGNNIEYETLNIVFRHHIRHILQSNATHSPELEDKHGVLPRVIPIYRHGTGTTGSGSDYASTGSPKHPLRLRQLEQGDLNYEREGPDEFFRGCVLTRTKLFTRLVAATGSFGGVVFRGNAEDMIGAQLCRKNLHWLCINTTANTRRRRASRNQEGEKALSPTDEDYDEVWIILQPVSRRFILNKMPKSEVPDNDNISKPDRSTDTDKDHEDKDKKNKDEWDAKARTNNGRKTRHGRAADKLGSLLGYKLETRKVPRRSHTKRERGAAHNTRKRGARAQCQSERAGEERWSSTLEQEYPRHGDDTRPREQKEREESERSYVPEGWESGAAPGPKHSQCER
ncbi:hypothetical protein CYLTODRAFT_410548 [Cylindrobasidium torrendii FP15055 ss-10]|uniref:Uncharacterized protein n=1 Tax=Cylindrobasidium torrendii FP15055 ss-10 TaxID=1314674 RepID=A0A0D7BCL1_9AGAR|nr:hypothetical protein CYLTODRAFT_410548 [Cylindrobasidium torrendii FP15055 ss-10]